MLMKMRIEQWWIDTDRGETQVPGEKPVLSATMHTTNLALTTWDPTQASAVRRRQPQPQYGL